MAKKVTFSSSKPRPRKRADTSFDFGFNTLGKTAKKAYRKAVGKTGS